MRLIPLALAPLLLAGCSQTPTSTAALDAVLDQIERRLDLAQPIAQHKREHQQPVQDTAREQQVLADALRNASAYSLPEDRVQRFLADQIEASKLVQYALLSRWQLPRQAPTSALRDLRNELRPLLDQNQSAMLRALAHFDQTQPSVCGERLAHAIADRANDSLRYLALVRATGQLCQTPPSA